MADIRTALVEGQSLSWLADRWNLTRAGVTLFCQKYVDPSDHAALAENGILGRSKGFDPAARLELVALCRSAGWSLTKTAKGMGVCKSALCHWLERNAPFGLEDALEDFRETEETHTQQAA
jgi:hypothetical protein